MGLLGRLFRGKESHTHFARNESGEVVDVYRSGDEPKIGLFRSRTPISDKFEKEYYRKHPEKRLSSRLIAAGRTIDKRVISKMQPIDINHNVNYHVKNNYNPFGSMFDSGLDYSSDYSGPSEIRIKSCKKKKVRNMDMFDNYGFMK